MINNENFMVCLPIGFLVLFLILGALWFLIRHFEKKPEKELGATIERTWNIPWKELGLIVLIIGLLMAIIGTVMQPSLSGVINNQDADIYSLTSKLQILGMIFILAGIGLILYGFGQKAKS